MSDQAVLHPAQQYCRGALGSRNPGGTGRPQWAHAMSSVRSVVGCSARTLLTMRGGFVLVGVHGRRAELADNGE